MPVHHFANDSTLIEKGLSNYWGYNTIGFFAPDFKYISSTTPGGQVQEFKAMVRTLHAPVFRRRRFYNGRPGRCAAAVRRDCPTSRGSSPTAPGE